MDETERYYYALQAGDLCCLRYLLRDGADVNHVFVGLAGLGNSGRPSTWSALHICCEKGHVSCARELLQSGADPNVYDRWNLTPLVYAVHREDHDMIRLLLDHGADVNLVDRKNKTPLYACVEGCDVSSLRMLLESGADPNIPDTLQRSPLWICASKDGHLAELSVLLDSESCFLDIPDIREKRTPLQAAIAHACQDRKEYVRLLLEAGCDVNNRDVRNHTALMNILWRTWAEGSDLTDEDYEICELLLQYGYDINSVGEKVTWLQYGGPVLNMAVERGVRSLVELLLRHGADPNVTDNLGNSSLLMAIDKKRLGIVCELIRHNVNINQCGSLNIQGSEHRLTPLQLTVLDHQFDMATLLILSGCDVTNATYIWASTYAPESLEANCQFWIWLNDFVTRPKSLLLLSRIAIRSLLGHHLNAKLQKLVLPPLMTSFIKMDDIVSRYTK